MAVVDAAVHTDVSGRGEGRGRRATGRGRGGGRRRVVMRTGGWTSDQSASAAQSVQSVLVCIIVARLAGVVAGEWWFV